MLVIVERGACSPEGVEERGEDLGGYQESRQHLGMRARAGEVSPVRETHTLWPSLHYPGG